MCTTGNIEWRTPLSKTPKMSSMKAAARMLFNAANMEHHFGEPPKWVHSCLVLPLWFANSRFPRSLKDDQFPKAIPFSSERTLSMPCR